MITSLAFAVSQRKWPNKVYSGRRIRVVPRSLSSRPCQGWEFFIYQAEEKKGGGRVESDLVELAGMGVLKIKTDTMIPATSEGW